MRLIFQEMELLSRSSKNEKIEREKNLLYFRNFQSPENQNLSCFSKIRYEYVFLKILNTFHLFYKLNQTILLVYKTLKAFFSVESFFSFQIFFIIYIGSRLTLFHYITNFFPNCHIFIKMFSSFIIKYIHLVLSEYHLCIFICGKNMRKDLISLFYLQLMKYFKSCLPKGNLLDTTILLISILFIELGLLC